MESLELVVLALVVLLVRLLVVLLEQLGLQLEWPKLDKICDEYIE